MIKYFEYTKTDGKTSDRAVIQLNAPTENILALDITEFSPEEREHYNAAVEEAQTMFKETINNIGLGSQYRYFKEKGISYHE